MRPSFLPRLGGEGLLVSLFVPDRRVVAQGRVTTMWVVPPFQELEDRPPRGGGGAEARAPEQFALQRGEETLAQGVVVRVAHRAHRRAHPKLPAPSPVSDRRVLTPLNGVVDDITGQALDDGHVQRG